MSDCEVHMRYFDPETVIVGNLKRKDSSYHANLQGVLNQEFQTTNFVRRKYGYFLDTERFLANELRKYREYVKLPDGDYSSINPEHNKFTQMELVQLLRNPCIHFIL